MSDHARAEPAVTPAPEAPGPAPLPVYAGPAAAPQLATNLALRPPEERAAVLGAMSRTSGNRAVTRMVEVSTRTVARGSGAAKAGAADERSRFPWIGEITGTWTAALRKSSRKDPADPHANTRADVPQGTPVVIVGRKGGWLRARVTLRGSLFEGYVSQELVKFLRRDDTAPSEAPKDAAATGPAGPGPSKPPTPEQPSVDPPKEGDPKKPPEDKPPEKKPPGDIIDPPPPRGPGRVSLKDLLDHARKTLSVLQAAAATAGIVAALALALEEAAKARVTMELLGVVRYLFFNPETGRLEFDLTNADYEARRRISRASVSEDFQRLEQALQRVDALEARALDPLHAGGTSEITTLTNASPEIVAGDVLAQYTPKSGFSGAYNPASGQWVAVASGDASLISGRPIQTVPVLGGHATAEAALIQRTGVADVSQNVGFVVIWEGNGTVRVTWNSGTINLRNFGDRAAPAAMRPAIRRAIENTTGCRVVE
jgi:hypothetical protein